MEALRQFRKSVTFGALRAGMEFSKRATDETSVELLRHSVRAVSKIVLPLRARLATNMKSVDMYRPELIDAHLDRAIDQMVMMAHVFRAGFANSGCPERFAFDESFQLLQQAYDTGRGVINIAPHLCGYPVYPPIVTPRIDCCIYMRRNKDPRKMRINEAIGLAGKGNLIAPPPDASKTQRLTVALEVLRQGKLMFITPDTPRKPADGVPVQIFGRTVHFPTGVFVMSLRTGAPIVPTWWYWRDGQYHIHYSEPIELKRGGNLREQSEMATKKWASDVDAYLRKYPEMWWNWLDKRWTQLLRHGRLLSRSEKPNGNGNGQNA
ncbi:MAG: lysophospholipid acyltransferase family protein [Phycisphaerae bacterium]|nr:lysophospholipid acyltransferase family protein [Phycisphaerae bacterium]